MILSDRDLLTSALTAQKSLAAQYLDTADHSASPGFLQLLMDICNHEQQARLQIYQMMHQRGWYSPKSMDQQQMQQAQQSFSQTRHQLTQQINQVTQSVSSAGYSGFGDQRQGYTTNTPHAHPAPSTPTQQPQTSW